MGAVTLETRLKPPPQQFEWIGYLPLDREDAEELQLPVGRCAYCGVLLCWGLRELHAGNCRRRQVKRKVVGSYGARTATRK